MKRFITERLQIKLIIASASSYDVVYEQPSPSNFLAQIRPEIQYLNVRLCYLHWLPIGQEKIVAVLQIRLRLIALLPTNFKIYTPTKGGKGKDGRTGTRTIKRVNGLTDVLADGRTETQRLSDGKTQTVRTNCRSDHRTDARTDGRTGGQNNESTNGQTEAQTEEQDRLTDGRTDGWRLYDECRSIETLTPGGD